MRRLYHLLPFLAAAAAAACAEQGTLEPRREGVLAASTKAASQITVMSRNMYVGADIDPVLQAFVGGDPAQIQAALQVAFAELQRTDFPTRINGIADEIGRNRPSVVGLQEVYQLHVAPGVIGPGSPQLDIDFLAALQQALAARSLPYVLAGLNTLTDVTLFGGAVILTDHDALLIDPAHVAAAGPADAHIFAVNLGDLTPLPFPVLRGYLTLPALVDGVPTLLVDSHTESGNGAGFTYLRSLQAQELAVVAGLAPNAILMGDLNDTPDSPLYQELAAAGLTDTWVAMRPGVAGYSCCELPDLSNHNPVLDQRIDYVWTKGFAGPSGRPQGQITLISDNSSGLLAGAFGSVWPSDHAGLVATFLLPAVQR
jgi:hypothetical protein